MNILGVSAFYHDAAAALIIDGDIAAAAQEERFTRIKHDRNYPTNAIAFCLEFTGVLPSQIDHVVFYDNPLTKFDRMLKTHMAFAPHGFKSFRQSIPAWLKSKIYQKNHIVAELLRLDKKVKWEQRLMFSDHHLSHAASAFFPSPFSRAAVLTMDGVGEWATTSLAIGNENNISIVKQIHFPHSLGLLYSAFTYYTGFKVNSGEYKVMGLAPYGVPRFADAIRTNLVDIKDDGTFRLNMEYFDYCTGLRMTNEKFDQLFGGLPRKSESSLDQHHMDLAASIQAVTEEIILKLTRSIASETGEKNLCLAGGVALNCVANGKIHKQRVFENIWIQPASGDAGGALGAALAGYHMTARKSRLVGTVDSMKGSYLGPEYSQANIEERLGAVGAVFRVLDDRELISQCADLLAQRHAIGWHQGRMEFGPRALGARSILGDPRSPTMQRMLNLKVKYRESFRPFAPSVLREDVSEWFDFDGDSPYMLLVAEVKENRRIAMTESENRLFGIKKLNIPRSSIPAVTHVDYTARVQTVNEATNPRYYALISAFKEMTGCPVLVNTSFNIRGEPIVNTPEDAFRCFMGTGIDALAVGNCLVMKEDQDKKLLSSYEHNFEMD